MSTPSREATAKAEIGHTEISRRIARLLTSLFLLVVFGVPLGQVLWERGQGVVVPQAIHVLGVISGPGELLVRGESSLLDRVFTANRLLQQEIDRYEEGLENESMLTQFALPPTQRILSGWLGAGNEKTYCGRDGWLFYRPAVEYLTGPGFLSARQLRNRSQQDEVEPDPRAAILQFNEQLRRHGVQLVVMPVPVKPMVHPEKLVPDFTAQEGVVQNPSYGKFVRELEHADVLVFDVGHILASMRRDTTSELYLRTDTHWRPETVERAARGLARFLTDSDLLPLVEPVHYDRTPKVVRNLGDIASMLQLPPNQTIYPPEEVEIRKVRTNQDELWHPSEAADVLVLGDSFSNVYSLSAMGWGEAAGFVEQLSYALKRPVDCILRNDDGAFATREILINEQARGSDRLKGKRVVVYQFAARELAVGDWKLFEDDLEPSEAGRFYCPAPGQEVIVTGTVAAASVVPTPGSVPYKDHIFSLHVTELQLATGSAAPRQAVVYMWSMRENTWTEAARYRLGQTVELLLRPWSDISGDLDRINRSELDGVFLLQEPCWGEPLP